MKFSLHMTSRKVLTFEIIDERKEEHLKALRPAEVFKRPVHMFVGELKTVSVNPHQIEWIEADVELGDENRPAAPLTILRSMTPAEFNEKVRTHDGTLLAPKEETSDPNLMIAYGMAEFKSGSALHLKLQTTVDRITRKMAALKVFEVPALVAKSDEGTTLVINPANIAVWQVVPGMEQSAYNMLRAELKSSATNV